MQTIRGSNSLHQNFDNPWSALEGPEAGETGLDIWGFLRRRKSFVVVFAVFGAGLAYLLYQQKVPQYRSTARMEVIQRTSERIFDGMLSKDMLADASFVIPSPHVLRPAYKIHNLSKLETLRDIPEDEAMLVMSGGLSIMQLSQGIIELQFTGPNPYDATRIADAVVDEYIRRQTSTYASESEKLTNILQNDRSEIEARLVAAEKDYEDFMQRSRILATGNSDQSRSRLSVLNGQISQLDITEAEMSSRLGLFNQKLQDSGQRDALLLFIGREGQGETTTNTFRQRRQEKNIESERRLSEALLPLVVEAAIIEQKVGPDHPKLRAIRKRIDLVQREHARIEDLFPNSESDPESVAAPVDSELEVDYLLVYQKALRHELEQLHNQRSALRELATAAESQAQLVSKDEQAELRLRRKVDRLQEQYISIASKIGQTELNKDMSGVRATVIMPASSGVLVYPILYRFLGFGCVLGLLAGLTLGYLIEMADRRFRKPEDVIKEFGLPILGHIPYLKIDEERDDSNIASSDVNPVLVCAHSPQSRTAEAFRSIRTTVYFAASEHPRRVLQITSPAAGDGKSTLATNLAISLAQSGKKTILVESDFRRPNVHTIMGIPNTKGIVNVLKKELELADAIQSTDINDLSVITCGKVPENPAELLTRPEYEILLDSLRQQYEYVVIDTPPVLAVTDSKSVAPRVDTVIMCMRLSRHTRQLGRRALAQLRDIGANMAGIVVNGVEESDAYGYGYASYHYYDYRDYPHYKKYKTLQDVSEDTEPAIVSNLNAPEGKNT